MGRRGVTIPYSPLKNGKRFWQPTPTMKAAGFQPKPLGPDGPESRREALRLYQTWEAHRTGRPTPQEPARGKGREVAEVARNWPAGSIGEAYVKFMRTPEWARLAHSTRNRDILPAWAYIRDAWGDCHPDLMTLEILSAWRVELIEKHGSGIAYRVFKEWRRHWKVMRAMRYVTIEDPSIAIRNSAPKGRWQTWTEGEAVRLVKRAIRTNRLRLAATVAAIWDTQFQPGDVRTLRRRHLVRTGRKGRSFMFDRTEDGRQKTGKSALGTLTSRSQRLLTAYLATLPDLLPEAFLFPLATGRVPAIAELSKEFRELCEEVFPGDRRQLRDMRRSGTVEAFAGGAAPADVGTKMANSIHRSNQLFSTYNPVDLASVKRADEARLRGRQKRREANEQ